MGSVWQAEDRFLHRTVAVKLIALSSQADTTARERFAREAQAAAGLSHPNIVTVHDFGVDGDTAFMVLEYLAGPDLASLVKARGPLPVDEALGCLDQAAAGLGAAHARGILHRDVKPANLMLNAHGALKVVDFGIAHLAEAAGQLTTANGFVGTLTYSAPERSMGSAATVQSDLYSLGCVATVLLTGHPPFDGTTGQLLLKHLNDVPSRLSDRRPELPSEVDGFVAWLLEKDPARRPSSADAVRSWIQAHRATQPAPPTPTARSSSVIVDVPWQAEQDPTRIRPARPEMIQLPSFVTEPSADTSSLPVAAAPVQAPAEPVAEAVPASPEPDVVPPTPTVPEQDPEPEPLPAESAAAEPEVVLPPHSEPVEAEATPVAWEQSGPEDGPVLIVPEPEASPTSLEPEASATTDEPLVAVESPADDIGVTLLARPVEPPAASQAPVVAAKRSRSRTPWIVAAVVAVCVLGGSALIIPTIAPASPPSAAAPAHPPVTTSGGVPPAEFAIGLITKTDTSPVHLQMIDGAQARANELGARLLTASGDTQSQIAAIDSLVGQGVKGILIAPSDPRDIVPALRKARAAGVVTIALNNGPEPLDAVDAVLATNNFELARLLGRWAAKRVAGTTPVIATLDLGDGDILGIQRHNGFLQGYGLASGLTKSTRKAVQPKQVACSANTAGGLDDGLTAMQTCLAASPTINLVYAANDAIAFGAYNALKLAGREKDAIIVTIGGDCEGANGIADGRLAAIAQESPRKMGSLGVEGIVSYVHTGAKPSGYTDTGATVITNSPQAGVESRDAAFGLESCWRSR
jgi:fructose transport system substrate-binding protein